MKGGEGVGDGTGAGGGKGRRGTRLYVWIDVMNRRPREDCLEKTVPFGVEYMKPVEKKIFWQVILLGVRTCSKVVQTPWKCSWPLVLVGPLLPPVDHDGEPGSTRKAAYTLHVARTGRRRERLRARNVSPSILLGGGAGSPPPPAAGGILPRSALLVTRRAYVDQHLSLQNPTKKPATEGEPSPIDMPRHGPRLRSTDVPCKHGEHARRRPPGFSP